MPPKPRPRSSLGSRCGASAFRLRSIGSMCVPDHCRSSFGSAEPGFQVRWLRSDRQNDRQRLGGRRPGGLGATSIDDATGGLWWHCPRSLGRFEQGSLPTVTLRTNGSMRRVRAHVVGRRDHPANRPSGNGDHFRRRRHQDRASSKRPRELSSLGLMGTGAGSVQCPIAGNTGIFEAALAGRTKGNVGQPKACGRAGMGAGCRRSPPKPTLRPLPGCPSMGDSMQECVTDRKRTTLYPKSAGRHDQEDSLLRRTGAA